MNRRARKQTLGITLALTVVFALFATFVFGNETSENFVIFKNNNKVGYLKTVQNGDLVDIEYYISDNGRGPKAQETIRLAADGRPIDWMITGVSYAGGAVQEHFFVKGVKASWEGLAESGQVENVEDSIYVAAAGSPWALGLYARYLMTKPEQTSSILPGGQIRLTKRRTETISTDKKSIDIDIYTLDGLYFTPNIFALDSEGNLFADFTSSYMSIREDFANQADKLKKLGQDVINKLQDDMHTRLANKIDVPWRITNVRIFDPVSYALSPPSTVSVFQNKILRVEEGVISSVPAGQKLIDGGGGTLMPGLVDMHAHESKWIAYQRLAAGITTVRDMGNDNQVLLEIDEKRKLLQQDGPRIVRAGYLEGNSDTKAFTGISVDTLEEALEAIRWYADRGYPYLKTYNGIKPSWVPDIMAEAKRLGLRVVGHIPAFTTADEMIKAGFHEITHINQLSMQYYLKKTEDPRTSVRLTGMHRLAHLHLDSEPVQHTIDLMKKHGVGLDTTIAAMERLNIQRDRVTPIGDALHLENMPSMFQRNRRRTFLWVPDPRTDAEHFKARDKLVEMVGLYYREGIPLWPGTDDEVAYTLHRELQLYVEAGIPVNETLEIATLRSIRELGLDHDLGTIEAGKLADFILIPGNPLEDITEIRKVNLVIKDGIMYFPSEIYKALNVKPFSASPTFLQ